MDLYDAKTILLNVRTHYRAGFGSSDKKYDMARVQKDRMEAAESRNRDILFAEKYLREGGDALKLMMEQEKVTRRLPVAGNALEMSLDAANRLANSEHKVHILYIGNVHTCCAVDYDPEKGIPHVVEELGKYSGVGACIIDPWLNIACGFRAYDELSRDKLGLWRAKAKLILHYSEWIGPEDPVFVERFDAALLYFEEYLPQAQGIIPRGRRTKSAGNKHDPD